MNNQYLQWISGQRRGEVESVEMLQDGQTFEDVVVLSNGRKFPMSKVGKDFIILPNSSAALPPLELDLMYPKEQRAKEKPLNKAHQEMMGVSLEPPAQNEKPVKQKKTHSTFATDLFSRSKKSKTDIGFQITVDMPSQSFFAMLNDTFDETTINEVIDIIAESIDPNELKDSIRNSILNFYGEI